MNLTNTRHNNYRKLLILWLAIIVLTVFSCNKPKSEAHSPTRWPELSRIEPYVPDANSVPFDITALPSGSGERAWSATYTSKGKTAKFEIHLGTSVPVKAKEAKDFTMTFGKGTFVAVEGSDASSLLVDLKQALEAQRIPTAHSRVKSLPFTFVNIGDGLSQSSDGGFNANPPGNWSAMKIFMGEGEQESEVFLNLNPAIKKGQFSIKDADYGDLVLSEFAKVL